MFVEKQDNSLKSDLLFQEKGKPYGLIRIQGISGSQC